MLLFWIKLFNLNKTSCLNVEKLIYIKGGRRTPIWTLTTHNIRTCTGCPIIELFFFIDFIFTEINYNIVALLLWNMPCLHLSWFFFYFQYPYSAIFAYVWYLTVLAWLTLYFSRFFLFLLRGNMFFIWLLLMHNKSCYANHNAVPYDLCVGSPHVYLPFSRVIFLQHYSMINAEEEADWYIMISTGCFYKLSQINLV